MALNDRVEQAVYFTSGDGYEVQPIDQPLRNKAFELYTEPFQHPFLLTPTLLSGTSTLVSAEGAPIRKTLVGRAGLISPQPNTDPIPVYNSLEEALFELEPRNLPVQRDNTNALFDKLSTKTLALQFSGGQYSGTLSFSQGNLVAAIVERGHEQIRGKNAAVAFLLLSAYQPLQFETTELNEEGPTYVGAGLNAIHASALPALAYTLRESLETRGLARHLFNIEEQDGRCIRAGSPTYTVEVAFSGIPVGILHFQDNQYACGGIRQFGDDLTGDQALERALELARLSGDIELRRTNNPDTHSFPLAPARKSALATTAAHLAQTQF